MDPSRNNLPLEFDKNKGKPPVVFNTADRDGQSNLIGEGSSTQQVLQAAIELLGHMDGVRPGSLSERQLERADVSSSTATADAIAAATAAASSTNTLMTNSQYNLAHNALGGNISSMGNIANMGSMGGAMMGPMGPMGPIAPNMMMGPMNMGQFGGMVTPMGPMGMMGPDGLGMGMMGPGPMEPPFQKEIVTLSSCVLYPPHPDACPHRVRERPPGCRTAFVGGLPENITEPILEEVFEKSGPIESIRLAKKNYAMIRFLKHESVEQAMYLSGYRMKIDDKDDKANTGRIHVDYANANNDKHEFECEQRAMAREMRHQQQVHEGRLRLPSPPPVTPFSIFEASNLLEVIKTDSGFMKASQQLVTWLERGTMDKRSSNLFYSLIQSSNSHVRRLVSEKQQHEEEVNQAKLLFKQRAQGIIVQLGQVESVFGASLKQRNWDHFTKAQRKNIDTWYNQVKEIRQSQQAQFLNERNEAEMELSDTEPEDREPVPKKRQRTSSFDGVAASMEAADQYHSLKEENDSLKCQLEAYINEAEMVKLEAKQNTDSLEKQIVSLQNALKGMQQQLISQQAQTRTSENKSPASDRRTSSLTSDKGDGEDDQGGEDEETEAAAEAGKPAARSQDDSVTSSGIPVTENEARMLGLICCFLNVHPNGATVDYLWSYLTQFMLKIKPRDVEDLLDRLPSLFRQEIAGVGATLERRWCFVGYQKDST